MRGRKGSKKIGCLVTFKGTTPNPSFDVPLTRTPYLLLPVPNPFTLYGYWGYVRVRASTLCTPMG
jgi:hypothetical protein